VNSSDLKLSAKDLLAWSMTRVLGRKNFVRLGRFLWMRARLDGPNDMARNGELLLQRSVSKALANQPSVSIIDVGANVGAWSQHMLANLEQNHGLTGVSIYLFEPAPVAFATLEREFAKSPLQATVRCQQVAISDSNGETSFQLFGPTHGINTLRPLDGEVVAESIEVPCATLDAVFEREGLQHVDLVKVDTEGNDLNVLRGAEESLRRGRIDYIQFEYNHRWIAFRCFLKDAFELAEQHGYRLGKLTPHGVEPYSRWHPELESFCEGNYLMWRKSLPKGLPEVPCWLDM